MKEDKADFINSVNTDMKTIMIGALDRFEEKFSYLWGDRVNEDELTDNELEFRRMWIEARTDILDYGNARIRRFNKRAMDYNISSAVNKVIFKVKDNNDDRDS